MLKLKQFRDYTSLGRHLKQKNPNCRICKKRFHISDWYYSNFVSRGSSSLNKTRYWHKECYEASLQ